MTLPDSLDKDFGHFIRKGSSTVRTKDTGASGRPASGRVRYGEIRRAIHRTGRSQVGTKSEPSGYPAQVRCGEPDSDEFSGSGSAWARISQIIMRMAKVTRISYLSFLEYSALMEDLAMSDPELLRRITVNPGIFGGKPIIRGMRISVELILSLLAQGETEDAILADYPDLAREDLRACLAYAHAVIAQDSLDAVQVQ
jgi:uncharacterized protein (DUF433 family)